MARRGLADSSRGPSNRNVSMFLKFMGQVSRKLLRAFPVHMYIYIYIERERDSEGMQERRCATAERLTSRMQCPCSATLMRNPMPLASQRTRSACAFLKHFLSGLSVAQACKRDMSKRSQRSRPPARSAVVAKIMSKTPY